MYVIDLRRILSIGILRVYKFCLSALAFFIASHGYAGKALLRFEALTDTKASLPRNSTMTVRYRVTNESPKTHTFQMTPVAGVTQIVRADTCASQFKLESKASCIEEIEIDGSRLIGDVIRFEDCEVGSQLECYRPSFAAGLDIRLTEELPVASLALLNAPLDMFRGTSLSPSAVSTLKIKNTSTNRVATNIGIDFSKTPLAGLVEVVSNNCTEILSGKECQIKVRPLRESNQNQLAVSLRETVARAAVGSTDIPSTTTTERVSTEVFSVGDSFEDGIVAGVYVNSSGDQFVYVVGAADEKAVIWAHDQSENVIDGTTGTTGGITNTAQIVQNETQKFAMKESYAAGVCFFKPTYFWYLPASNELYVILEFLKDVIGGFSAGVDYWSSTTERGPNNQPTPDQVIVYRLNSTSGSPVSGVSTWATLNTYRCVHIAVSQSLDG